jgi:hypothetical protein
LFFYGAARQKYLKAMSKLLRDALEALVQDLVDVQIKL